MRDALVLLAVSASLLVALRYPFAGVITWAWFSVLTPHQMAYGVWGISLNVIIAGVTILSALFHGEWRKFRFDAITGLVLLLAFWLWMSQVFSLDPKSSATFFDRFIKQLLFVLICVQLTSDRLRFQALVWMLVVGMGYFAAKGAAFTIIELGQHRVQGIEKTVLEDNNHMGIALATTLPLILYLRETTKNAYARIALTALFVMTIVSVLGTHSRGAFVALVVFGGFYWLRSRRKFTILVALALASAPAIAFMPAKWTERMTTIRTAEKDASFMGRVDAWVINAKLAAERPLTGAGLRNSYQKAIAASVDPVRAERAKAAHSIYFEMLGGTGFVGLAIYLALLGTALLKAGALAAEKASAEWRRQFGFYGQTALVVFMAGGATVSLEMWDGYLILIAMIAAAGQLASNPARIAPAAKGWRMAARGGAAPRSPAPSGPVSQAR